MALFKQYQAAGQSMQIQLDNSVAFIQADMEGQKRAAAGLALAIAGQPDMAGLIGGGKRDELVGRYAGNLAQLRSDADLHLITFSNAGATVVARVHDATQFGDNLLARRRMIAEALGSGRLTAGIEPGRASLGMFASVPVVTDGRVTGIVDVGTALTNDYFNRLKQSLRSIFRSSCGGATGSKPRTRR